MAHPSTTIDSDPVAGRAPLVTGDVELHDVTEAIVAPVEWTPPRGWYIVLGLSLTALGVFLVCIAWLVWEGVGIWGNNTPVGWGWPIVNFVFWVGIGHAGTLISAVLFLFRQRWRTGINRAAEAMTLFAVMCALVFPAIHTGRPWLAYWLFPIPNQMDLWPQFRSPLLWDVFAVSIYFIVSLLFWYLGLIPDLATLRDRAKTRVRKLVYGFLALGWRNSGRHWLHYEKTYLILAALATPLVLSVHSVVSFDFAASQVPGWHSTVFPPYFVAGAIFSGMAMVLTLMLVCRVVFKMEHLITMLHFDRMAKLMLVTSTIVGYAYGLELFIAWYSGNEIERFTFANRAFGPYAWAYWIMVGGNVLVPQLFWFKRYRSNIKVLFVVSILVNIGMWFERFVIVVSSLANDYLPSSWDYFSPTVFDVLTLVGSFGLFFTMFTLFVRYFPMVSIAEVKGVLPNQRSRATDEPPAETPPVSAGGEDYVLARFDSADALKKGAAAVRDNGGYKSWDTHAPFAVHGLDKAMGLSKSPVGWFAFVGAMMGIAGAMLLQWWTSAVDYPLDVSGKPFFSWPAFIPITFECGILGGVLGALVGFFHKSRLPRHYHTLFFSERFDDATDDGFFISVRIDKDTPAGNIERFMADDAGAVSFERVMEPS